jgi:hypothetical protein
VNRNGAMLAESIAPFGFEKKVLELRERRFLNFAVPDAGGADAQALARPLHNRVDRLQVQIPTTLCHIVGMTDPMPELRPTATHFTSFCHMNTRPRSSLSGSISLT